VEAADVLLNPGFGWGFTYGVGYPPMPLDCLHRCVINLMHAEKLNLQVMAVCRGDFAKSAIDGFLKLPSK
jgi:hypothetical protein